MNLQLFVANRRPEWDRLWELTRRAGGRPRRLSAEELIEVGTRYRAVAADLSQLRRNPDDPALIAEIEALAQAGRQLVYDSEHRRPQFLRFLISGYWRLVASRPALLGISAAILLIPAALVAVWALISPAEAIGQVPPEFYDVLDPGPTGTEQGLTLSDQIGFSTSLFVHNTWVSFGAFSLGILFGIGTVYILLTNGVMLGAIGGLLIGSGNGGFFVELVAAHGILEISGIIVAGAAGLRMGWALVDPGDRNRREALVEDARDAVLMVAGTIPFFAVAGLIKGVVSRRGLAAVPMLITGLTIGFLYWGSVWVAARRVRAAKHS